MSYRKLDIQFSKFRIEATKIAKRLNVNMSRCTEREIEIIENDSKKEEVFRKEIEVLNERTNVTDLIRTGQYTDTRGNDILNTRSLYLEDDDYYNWIIGEEEEETGQASMF